jgi:hypothetical protein
MVAEEGNIFVLAQKRKPEEVLSFLIFAYSLFLQVIMQVK